MKKALSIVTAAIMLQVLGFPSYAATLDQQNVSAPVFSGAVNRGISSGQTFVAGLTGSLAAIELDISKFVTSTADVTLTVYDGFLGTALGMTSVPASDVNDTSGSFVFFDFSSSLISMVAGEDYWFEASTDELSNFGVNLSSDTYLAGLATQTDLTFPGFDARFKTYVDVSVVPVPAGLPLLLTSIWGLSLIARRWKRLKS